MTFDDVPNVLLHSRLGMRATARWDSETEYFPGRFKFVHLQE